MARYVAGRLVAGGVTLFLFVTMLFFLARLLMPMRQEPGGAPSVWEQYTAYLGHLVDGDLLQSGATGALPWTLLILAFAVGIAFPLGHWIGKTAGWKSGAAGAPGITVGAVLAYTVFPPLLVFALIMGVSRLTDDQGLGFLRTLFNEGGLDPETAWTMLRTIALIWLGVGVAAVLATRSHRVVPRWAWATVLIAGPFLLWAALGMWDEVSDILLYLGMPIIAVAILVIGEVILVSKSTTAEAAHEDFVFTARAKGVSDNRVRDHHAARYALIPTLSKLMVSVPFILVGLMIVELSFGWPKFGFDMAGGTGLGAFGMVVPGMSSTVFTALEFRDTTTVIDGLLVVGVIVLVMRLILEVLHAALDPRIRVGSRAQ